MDTNSTAAIGLHASRRAAKTITLISVVTCLAVTGFAAAVMPHDLGKDYVIVNLPDFTLRVFHDGQQIWMTRIVTGKPSMATPIMSAEMKYITVNPTWNVPPSIVMHEYLPALAADPTVLARMGLRMSYTGAARAAWTGRRWHDLRQGARRRGEEVSTGARTQSERPTHAADPRRAQRPFARPADRHGPCQPRALALDAARPRQGLCFVNCLTSRYASSTTGSRSG